MAYKGKEKDVGGSSAGRREIRRRRKRRQTNPNLHFLDSSNKKITVFDVIKNQIKRKDAVQKSCANVDEWNLKWRIVRSPHKQVNRNCCGKKCETIEEGKKKRIFFFPFSLLSLHLANEPIPMKIRPSSRCKKKKKGCQKITITIQNKGCTRKEPKLSEPWINRLSSSYLWPIWRTSFRISFICLSFLLLLRFPHRLVPRLSSLPKVVWTVDEIRIGRFSFV